MKNKILPALLGMGLLISLAASALSGGGGGSPIIPPPGSPILSVSTVPSTGDQNPYGVAFVPNGFPQGGPLNAGDVLVSNFNNAANLQGTGSTIVQIKQSGGPASVFFQGEPGLGLNSALGVLKTGFVIVGSTPTTDGTCFTLQQGGLLIIDRHGNLVTTLSDPNLLQGPWGLTIHEQGNLAQVFVSNVFNGVVTRINLATKENGEFVVESMTQIASGYRSNCSEVAVVIGPTGLAYDPLRDILYVASTNNNKIFAVSGAGTTQVDNGTGSVIYEDSVHLHGPLALVLAPNGDLITANGDAFNEDLTQLSEIVEFTPTGQFVNQFQIDPVVGSAFGLAIEQRRGAILFAAVDDNTSTLSEWSE
jgi:hypothetical protein